MNSGTKITIFYYLIKMLCCSGGKRHTKPNGDTLDGGKAQLYGSKYEIKTPNTNQNPENEADRPPLNTNLDQSYTVEDESIHASKCYAFPVFRSSFTQLIQNLVAHENQRNEIHICLQDETSLIMSLSKIKEDPQIEEIPEVSASIEGSEDDDQDPDRELTEEEAKTAAIYRWARENHEYSTDTSWGEVLHRVVNFKPLQSKEESRFHMAHNDGGKVCRNKKLVRTLRAIARQLLHEIGRQILSGSMNLTTISFPIRAMIPKSALEKILMASCLFPLYINRACSEENPIERLKLVICATLGNFYLNCSFLKPLNPILGETISGSYIDGTICYAEQISHHPPISYVLAIGPQNSYRFYGYYNYEAKAGLNSLSLKNKGKRFLQFKNGGCISYNFANEEYSGSFWGAMKVECKGKINFTDQSNDLTASLEFDNVFRKPSDYFSGEIKQKGKRVCKIYGSYMGYIEFGDQRYWDVNYIRPYECKIDKPNPLIQSDASFRQDLRCLKRSKVAEAQQHKDKLETMQRQDGKLRQSNKATH